MNSAKRKEKKSLCELEDFKRSQTGTEGSVVRKLVNGI